MPSIRIIGDSITPNSNPLVEPRRPFHAATQPKILKLKKVPFDSRREHVLLHDPTTVTVLACTPTVPAGRPCGSDWPFSGESLS